MGLARNRYVCEGEEGVYHCFSRCVRRAFLCGYDALTGRDFSHRRTWLVDRLRYLATVFAIEVCAYAILMNHWHAILRTRPDIVAGWTDREVAFRWLTLFPRREGRKGVAQPPSEDQIRALADNSERIVELRKRLCSLSWFMGRVNEFVARAANKEDGVKGRFWEGRFKCQALLDDPAIVSCMTYVDLNMVCAGLAATPEMSDFTSIQERIRAWHQESMISDTVPDGTAAEAIPVHANTSACWLCPIQSDSQRRGILQMTLSEYIDLVDRSGRIVRADKRGAIDPSLDPILCRLGANPKVWSETISHFGSRFHLAAGLPEKLRSFAEKTRRRWVAGISAARSSFSLSSP